MSPFDDPLTLFRAAVDALNAEDWPGAARLCDPASLGAFHRSLVERFAPAVPAPLVSADTYVQLAPDVPRAVAEYLLAQQARNADPATRLEQELPGVGSAAALRALSPEATFVRWLVGNSFRTQVERIAARKRIARRVMARYATQPPGRYAYVLLGAVYDGERIAHVLFRTDRSVGRPPGHAPAQVAEAPADEQALESDVHDRGFAQVALCRRQPDGTWRLVAGHDFLGMSSVHVADVTEYGDDGQPVTDDPDRDDVRGGA